MIAAARSCFSGYRFDGETTNCLRVFVVPRWLGASAVYLVSCRHVLGHACLIRPSVGIAFSFLARVCVISPGVAFLTFPSSASLGGDYVPGACPRSHHLINHLVRRGYVVPVVLVFRFISLVSSLSSGAAIVRWTAGVAFHLPLPRSRMSWGKQRGMRFLIHRPLMPPVFSFLVSPCRLVGRLVPYLSS